MGKEGYLLYPLFLPIWRRRSKEQRWTTGGMGPLYDMPLPRHSRSVRSRCTVTARGNQSHHTNKKAGPHLDVTLRKGRNASEQLNPGWQDTPTLHPVQGFLATLQVATPEEGWHRKAADYTETRYGKTLALLFQEHQKHLLEKKVPLLVAPSSSPSSHRNVMPVM